MCSDDTFTLDNRAWLRQLFSCPVFLDHHVCRRRMAQAEARRPFFPSYRHLPIRSALGAFCREGVKMVVDIYGAQCGNPGMGHVAIPLTVKARLTLGLYRMRAVPEG